jgi:hypothetical protein
LRRRHRAVSLEECHGQAAVSAGGLLEVGSRRRHASLQGAWRRQAAGAYIRDRAHARYVREGSLKGGAPLKTWQRNMVVQDVRPRTSYFFLVFLVFFVFLVFLMFLVFLVLALMYLWYLVMVSWNARRAAAGTILFSSACLMVT